MHLFKNLNGLDKPSHWDFSAEMPENYNDEYQSNHLEL